MAYGDITATSSREDSATTTHTVSLPTLKNNDFLILTFSIVNNTGDIATTPTGWTLEHRHAAVNKNMYVFTRRANGGEGSSLEITTSASVVTAHTCLAIEKAKKNNRSADGEDSGSDTMAAGAFSPGEAGIDPYLVLVTYTSWAGATPGTITAWPSSFTEGRTQTNQTGQGVSICATPLINNDSVAKSHTKSTSLAWVAGALSLIEDTSDPPAEPAPKAKTLLYPGRCLTVEATKTTACETLLKWCAPEADELPTVLIDDTTEETLPTLAGTKLYANRYKFDVSIAICGEPHTDTAEVADCGEEGRDYTLVTAAFTRTQVYNDVFCGPDDFGTITESQSWAPEAPTVADTFVLSYDLSNACAGDYPASTYLGRWRLTQTQTHSTAGEQLRCEELVDIYLTNGGPFGAMLQLRLESVSVEVTEGIRCFIPGGLGSAFCTPIANLPNGQTYDAIYPEWTDAEIIRQCLE